MSQTRAIEAVSADESSSAPVNEEEYVIEVEDLVKSFGDNHVLKGVSCRVPKRKITVVIGGSGSGKSVLIKHMIGLFQQLWTGVGVWQ